MYTVNIIFCKYVTLYILALMQPSYALLPATSYPKTVGGMCYAIIELTLIGLKQPITGKEARYAIPAHKCTQAIQACSCPIIGQGS